ncbi:MAG TPA: aldehyde dehydrogenase family protein [Gaiellaceae bacterium]|nr:aldehyde dehydrogenase family protein [Gaiellaceae bacterium]
MGVDTARAFASREHRLLVGGEWVASGGGEELPVEDPSTEEPLAVVPQATEGDVDAAVGAARSAFDDGRWSRLSPDAKTVVLQRLAGLVEEHAEELAALESLDNGKAIAEARGDVAGVATVLRYYAGWPSKIHGETNPTEERFLAYTVREPVGVCGQIVPWNYPLLMASWKLGPALACGNTVVLKPAEQTPLSALRLGELCLEAGVPAGVVNVVTGDGRTGAALVAHPQVDKIAFTGSTEVGKLIMAAAAPSLKRVSLELGGKNPNVVFADADLDAAVKGALAGAFENGGMACIAGSRLLVERAAYDEVVERLAVAARALRVGPGIDESTDVGAIVSREQLDKIRSYVELGRAEGAELVAGGDDAGRERGYFLAPAVFAAATPEMRIAREEIFGPVVAAIPFDDPQEAAALANDTPYGLAGAIWTRDVKKAHALARALRAGTVWVNAYGSIRPTVSFGGFKQSGFGRELGLHSLETYTELKSVFVDLT